MECTELVELLKTKNEKAISQLYDQYAPPLYGVIFRIVLSHEHSELVLERTFFVVLDTIHAYDSHNLFTWMTGIARTIAQQNELPTNSGSATIRKSYSEEYRSAERYCSELMEGMESQCEKVLMHVYFQNRTILETSLVLNLPLQEVKVLLRSALHHVNNRINSTTRIASVAAFIFSTLICFQ